jgi:flagellar P-ring protein FlgI
MALTHLSRAAAVALVALASLGSAGQAQTAVRDLVIEDQAVPVRLMGYGLVVGLDNTGDNGYGGRSSQQTVQSVVNLLKRFDVSVPAELLRTRNVAAVLVTAEVSPYLRAGGKFEIHVSSVGDARSLRGGVLWMTPLVADAGGQAIATAQGQLLVTDYGAGRRRSYVVETTGRIPDGGLIEGDLPRPASFASTSRLLLRDPDVGTASRIAAAIDTALGAGTAKVEDPGAIALTLKEGDPATQLSKIRDLTVRLVTPGRIVIDAHDGTVVAGGELPVGAAVVSVGSVTLSIGGSPADTLAGKPDGRMRLAAGTSVQQLITALHAVQTPPSQVALIFEALRRAGSISAEVVSR